MKLSHSGFDLHFLIADDVEHPLMGLLSICISSLGKCLFKSLPSFNWVFSFLFFPVVVELLEFFIYSIQFSYQINDLQIFPSILWVIFSPS